MTQWLSASCIGPAATHRFAAWFSTAGSLRRESESLCFICIAFASHRGACTRTALQTKAKLIVCVWKESCHLVPDRNPHETFNLGKNQKEIFAENGHLCFFTKNMRLFHHGSSHDFYHFGHCLASRSKSSKVSLPRNDSKIRNG